MRRAHVSIRPSLAVRQTAIVVAAVGLAAVAGCERGGKGSKATSAPAGRGGPSYTLLAPESAKWSREKAVQHLKDGKLGVSAAVRLVRLAGESPLCVPEPVSDAVVRRLRLVSLGEDVWALGIADRNDQSTLHAPVLIGLSGTVVTVADGTEEEASTLCMSGDAEVFPHLIVTPRRVLMAEIPLRPALTLASPDTIGFALRAREGLSYVALVMHGPQKWVEVASYRWGPYELDFEGPASDKLPDPPGGKFALDMEQSPLLVPRGGEIPPPVPREENEDEMPPMRQRKLEV
jgi:hypothetical protein